MTTPKAFKQFLKKIEGEKDLVTNTTAAGTLTIQQTTRNQLRAEGVEALREDLIDLYGDDFDILTTKEGIVIVVENENFTFSWEIKNTIKALDYDPYYEADKFDSEQEAKATRKAAREAEKAQKIKLLEERRAKKLAQLAARNAEVDE